MNYLGFQASSGVHHSVEEFISTEIERDLGDSGTWVVLTITWSTVWHLSWDDWTSLAPGPNCWWVSVIQQSVASSSLRGLALGIGLHLLSRLWRLVLYQRENFVVVHTYYLLSIILAICWAFQIGISIVAGSSILWIKNIWDVLACISYCIWLRYVPWLSLSVICCIHTYNYI